jgi:hypothetical protein
MSEMTLFGKKSTGVSTKFAGLQGSVSSVLTGGGQGNRRISIKGGVFREIVGGKEVRINDDRAMNVAIIKAATVSRMFFGGAYVEGETSKPTCWSSDGNVPAKEVPEAQRQSARCKGCKQDIKGSGQNDSRACKFQQRVAIMLDGDIASRNVYQIILPATSVFGDAENGKMPLQAYARHCDAHSTLIESIITEMRFDTASPTPKLVFKPVRELTDDEADVVLEMMQHPDTIKAVTLNVSQTDGVIPAPKLAAPEPKAEVKAPDPEPEVKKAAKKPAPVVEEKPAVDLAEIVGEWDDE